MEGVRHVRYEQSNGSVWLVNGQYDLPLAEGYAGRGLHRDRPESQCLKNEGPLPQGVYSMRVLGNPNFAAPAIKLVAIEGTDLCGRSGFWVHGNNAENDASHGCVVLDRAARRVLASLIDLGFDRLYVVP